MAGMHEQPCIVVYLDCSPLSHALRNWQARVNAQRDLVLDRTERKFGHMSAKEADIESARAAIQALNQQWEKNFENHDAAGLVALFTEDCVRMPQGGPATVGRLMLEAAYRQDFAEVWKAQAKVRLDAEEVILSGAYAFARGTDTLIQDQDGKQVPGGETGKWLFVYRPQPDGTWKYHWTTFNRND
jgi:uncharacterized protein (TIGR02246 family)